VELAHFLLEQGADPNASAAGYTALHWASGRWETGFTTDYSFSPRTTAEWAAVAGLPTGKAGLIKALIARGADVNARLRRAPPRSGRTLFKNNLLRGATPFYLAALVGDIETMRLLLAHGADPTAAADGGTPPLLVAAGLAHQDNESVVPEARYLEAVKLLVELGADVHAVNGDGWTALHAAAYVGHQSVVQYLLDRGGRLNQKNKWGQTALGIAEGYCSLREVKGRILPMAGCIVAYRPEMAEFLRKLGGVSEGRVELNSAGELVVTSSVSASSLSEKR
jgi:cytohesin